MRKGGSDREGDPDSEAREQTGQEKREEDSKPQRRSVTKKERDKETVRHTEIRAILTEKD